MGKRCGHVYACPVGRLCPSLEDVVLRRGTVRAQRHWICHKPRRPSLDRKSTRLNSSHLGISDAVFCLKKELSGKGEPERLRVVAVSENFFPVLGVAPQIGRLFSFEECKCHGPNVLSLTHGLSV